MNDWNDLYMEVILDHNKNPRNKGIINEHTNHADGHNPLCGDNISLDLIIDNDIVKEIKFTGSGCAISTASSSILTEAILGKKIEEIRHLFEDFHELVTKDNVENNNLGKPQIHLNRNIRSLLINKFKLRKFKIFLSLADESKHSIAFVIINKI